MMVCLNCGLQKPNWYSHHECPNYDSYLRYISPDAIEIIIKFHSAGLHISYAVADVYEHVDKIIYTAKIIIGISHPYPAIVFSRIPDGYEYIFPDYYDTEFISHLPIEHLISPVRTYTLLQYESKFLDKDEAKIALKTRLNELEAWIDDAVTDWLLICKLGGWLD